MKKILAISLIVIFGLASSSSRAALNVVASIGDFADVAQRVGGDHVVAKSLTRGSEDPHFIGAKPSLMKAVQKADVYVAVGLELEVGWLPVILQGSRNPKIQPGSPGFVDASEGVSIIEKVEGAVDRSQGDIHPEGNPHYYMDPEALVVVSKHLADKFSELDPANKDDYQKNALSFKHQMDGKIAEWRTKLKPFKGAPVVTYHRNMDYFLVRFNINLFGEVEPKGGIPPSPRYLDELAGKMRKSEVRLVLYQPYYDADASRQLAKKAGGVALELPTEAGGSLQAKDVISKFDLIVTALATNLGKK